MNIHYAELLHIKPQWLTELGDELAMGTLAIIGFIFVLLGTVLAAIFIMFGMSIGVLN